MLGYTWEIVLALQFIILFLAVFVLAGVGLILTTVRVINEQFEVVKKLLEK